MIRDRGVSGMARDAARAGGAAAARPVTRGDRHRARQSLREERKAIRDYERREHQTDDPKLRRTFEHAESEERQHARAFRRHLHRRGGRR